MTAKGDLRLCLFGEFGVPLRPLLQRDDDQDALLARITTQLGLKAAGHGLHQGQTGLTRTWPPSEDEQHDEWG